MLSISATHTFPIFTVSTIVILISFPSPLDAGWNGWDGELDWWQDTIVYQIYPASFQDSDGDGIGDLKGILSRLDYFVETGIKTFWVSPIFKSPMADLGYDVSDFKVINSLFGTMDDFKELMKGVRERGLRILMDFVPNHTSNEHEWFQRSIRNETPYRDYYIWKDGIPQPDGSTKPPNNWLSLFGGSGWTFVPERGQYYYHQFSVKQPDLDFRNDDVKREMIEVLKYWLDLGVDGFRMDAVKHLLEDESLEDEAYIDPDGNKQSYNNMYHNLTTDRYETYDLIYQWREFLDDYAANLTDNHTRVMLTEAYSSPYYLMLYYGNGTNVGAHSPFNFFLLQITHESNATQYENLILEWIENMPDGSWPNWVIGNHDNHRVASRLGENMVDAMAMMSMLLPGTSVTYQGEELGQPDTLIRRDQIRDPNNNGFGVTDIRDPQRGPYMWNESENSGFTTRKRPWEPINPSYWKLNLQRQKTESMSHFKIYQKLAQLRKHITIQKGTLTTHILSPWVFSFVRRYPGNDTFVVVINCGSEREVIVLRDEISRLPETLEVIVPSLNSGYRVGDRINPNAFVDEKSSLLVLRPKASVVLRSSYITTDPSDNTKPNSCSHSEISFGVTLFSLLMLLLRIFE